MLRDNLVGLIEPMPTARENDGSSLALSIHKQRQASDDRSSCLKNPRPAGAESSLTERTTSPFQTEPRHGERSRTLPRRFRMAPLFCHSLNKRLAVNAVTLAAPASSSFVASNSNPPATFSPMPWAKQVNTPASLSRAEWLTKATWAATYRPK